MIKGTSRRRMTRALLKAGLVAVVSAMVVGGVATSGVVSVHADDLEVVGTPSLQPEGNIEVQDEESTYGLVSGIDLTPFLDRSVQLVGNVDGGTLFVHELTVGAIDVQSQDGVVTITTVGTVEETENGFHATVEGITFTLVDSDDLAGSVGQQVTIEGELAGTWISVTSLGT